MSGRAIIIVVTGVIIISSIIFAKIEAASTNIAANYSSYYYRQSAQNIAQSGVNMGLRQLIINSSWRTGYTNLSLMGGKVTVRAFDTTFASLPSVGISATATIATDPSIYLLTGLTKATTATSMAYVPRRKDPPGLKASLTTSTATSVNGGMTIDGRNHTITGALIAPGGTGIYGVWTTSSFSQGGASTVGGTDVSTGTDYAPKGWPKDSKSILSNQPPYPGFPTTPDSVFGGASFGYPEGTLKTIAQSGLGGSQYVTDPAKLKFPLVGVTYVELAAGVSWAPSAFNGTGIVICHNVQRNAYISSISGTTFTGILIGDDIVHIHSTIIGAVISLTVFPSQGNVIGNGQGSILYSSAAVKAAADFLKTGGGGSGGNVLAWWE